MGKTQSTLQKKGYVVQRKKDDLFTGLKGDDEFAIKEIPLPMNASTTASIETLRHINHPHIVRSENSFEDTDGKVFYIVMDQCKGGNLADKIYEQKDEKEILSWFVQICMALKHIHEVQQLHKNLNPKTILFTDSGTICLGEFGAMTTTTVPLDGAIHYLSPETLAKGIYGTKSDIWSLGCVLYELCEQKLAFTGESTIELIPKILGGPYPSLENRFSADLQQLLKDIFQTDPASRPSASEILSRPFIIKFIIGESNATVGKLQSNLKVLNDLADGLESVHKGATIGSLAGGVIGVAGGITSIVGLILAPFTLGASLIVTGVGIGVAVAGGATAGVSNVTNMYTQSSDRKAIKNIVKEFGEKTNSIVTSLQNIGETFQTLQKDVTLSDLPNVPKSSGLNLEKLGALGARAGRGLGGITELVRLVQVANVGKIVAQSARALRVVEGVTGVLSALFVAVDIYFIALDAREIHRINEAQAARPTDVTTSDSMATSELLPESGEVKSETMKFIFSIRKASESLQEILGELSEVLRVFSREILP